MSWFYQTRGYGLGNFVMATPALRLVAKSLNKKIDVYFETPQIKELYVNCPFINIIQSQGPKSSMIGRTGKLKLQKGESEIQGFCRTMAKVNDKLQNLPHTYVDNDISRLLSENIGKHVAIFHGCLGQCYIDKKDVGSEIRQHIINTILNNGLTPAILGSKSDHKTYWSKNDLSKCQDFVGKLSLKDSVSILSQCKFFISNDTGLYHVAGALKKDGLVLWKATNPIKNQSPHSGILHIIGDKQSVINAISKYVSERK